MSARTLLACYLQSMFSSLGRGIVGFGLALVSMGLFMYPATASAFCRTTTQPLPQNYSPTYGCYTQGMPLFWRNACVSYSINETASRNISYEVAERIIDASFATWVNSTCAASGYAPGISVSNIGAASCGEVRYNSNGPNQNLIVFRDDGWPYDDPNSTLGLTTVTFNSETGEIYDADMEINASGRNLSTADQVPANGFDLASVITHEVGHFFGLAHATDPRSTMFASYKPGTTALRSLTADDIAGLCTIYPNESTRIVSPLVSSNQTIEAQSCDPTPRHGLTGQCSVTKSEEKCATTPRPGVPWVASSGVVVALAGVLLARRRRAPSSADVP